MADAPARARAHARVEALEALAALDAAIDGRRKVTPAEYARVAEAFAALYGAGRRATGRLVNFHNERNLQ